VNTAPELLERAAQVLRDRQPSPKVDYAAGTLALLIIQMAERGAPDAADELVRLAYMLRG